MSQQVKDVKKCTSQCNELFWTWDGCSKNCNGDTACKQKCLYGNADVPKADKFDDYTAKVTASTKNDRDILQSPEEATGKLVVGTPAGLANKWI